MRLSRAPAYALLFALLALSSLAWAEARVELLAPESNAEVYDTSLDFGFYYSAGSNGSPSASCTLTFYDQSRNAIGQVRSINVSDGDRTRVQGVKFLPSRTYRWQVYCGRNMTSATSEERRFTVKEPAPSISLLSPIDLYTTDARSVDFTFRYTSGSDHLDRGACQLILGPFAVASVSAPSGNATTVRVSLNETQEYPWHVECNRPFYPYRLSSENRSLILTPEPPPLPPSANTTPPNLTILPDAPPPVQTEVVGIPAAPRPPARLSSSPSAQVDDTVALRLSDAAGLKPLAGVRIILALPDGSVLKTAPTDAEGRTSFKPPLAGRYAASLEGRNLSAPVAIQVSARPDAPAPPAPSPDISPSSPPAPSPAPRPDESLIWGVIAAASVGALVLLALVARAALSGHPAPPVGPGSSVAPASGASPSAPSGSSPSSSHPTGSGASVSASTAPRPPIPDSPVPAADPASGASMGSPASPRPAPARRPLIQPIPPIPKLSPSPTSGERSARAPPPSELSGPPPLSASASPEASAQMEELSNAIRELEAQSGARRRSPAPAKKTARPGAKKASGAKRRP